MANQLLIDLFQAYYDARANKRNSTNALEFEINYEQNIFQLYRELKSGTYQIGRSVAFIVFKPVQREIIASPFRDRIIHHLLFNYINPIFEPLFINDSYSCRRGRGTTYGIKRMAHFIRSSSNNYQKNFFILKLDLAGYFMSINHQQLYDRIVGRLLKEKNNCSFDLNLILELLRKIIFNNYTHNCIVRGGRDSWRGLPANKSLFFNPPGIGLPIGNLTSQLFSNIYLNSFDHFAKRVLRLKYYGRYVDDFVIISVDKERLKLFISQARDYLSGLGLKLHPKKIYLQSGRKGVDFLGAIIRPRRIYVRHRTKSSFYRFVTEVNGIFKNKEINKPILYKILAGINSYLGLLAQHQTYYLRRKILTAKLNSVFWKFFRLAGGKGKYRKVILKKMFVGLYLGQ